LDWAARPCFTADTYPGYSNKYGNQTLPGYYHRVDDSFPIGDAVTWVFAPR